jgi:hypothetical protein
MSSNRFFRILSILGISLVVTACVHVERQGPASQADQTKVVRTTGAACQAPSGPASDGAIAYRCSVPAGSVGECPQFLCRRCNNGTWGAEFPCQLR